MAVVRTSLISRIAPAVARRLGFYVYLYVNPIDEKVFYVGKGKNRRALAHLKADERRKIRKVISGIQKVGKEPRIEILAHGLGSERDALKVEAAAIDLLGLSSLANQVRGHGVAYGRMPLDQVEAHYTKREADIREASVLIRINRQYRYGMSEVELYDATRSAWKVGNLLILMGQRPDAHFILMSQNQLSPIVRQDRFPLFEHSPGAAESEFAQFVRRVVTEKMPFTPAFVDAVYAETSGHPFLTVNVLVDMCQWLIDNDTAESQINLDAKVFREFSLDRLSVAALQRSPFYLVLQKMLGEYVSELGRTREPWLHVVAVSMQRLARANPKTLRCGVGQFKDLLADIVPLTGLNSEQFMLGASMANFLRVEAGQVAPAIPLLARLASATEGATN